MEGIQMKRGFKFYFVTWAVLLTLFNVIAFVLPGWAGVEKYTASFWIGYGFIMLTFLGQLICAYFGFRGNDLKKMFYSISLVTTSYTGLVLSFVFGGLCMLISPLMYWVSIVLCAIVLAINVVAVAKAAVAIAVVGGIDDKIKAQTLFIKSLTVDAESLMARAKTEAIKAECKNVYEAVRYSDPMSHEALASVESEITLKFATLAEAVIAENNETVSKVAEELVVLLGDRNKKCKLLK